jgi:hypothetical protein
MGSYVDLLTNNLAQALVRKTFNMSSHGFEADQVGYATVLFATTALRLHPLSQLSILRLCAITLPCLV